MTDPRPWSWGGASGTRSPAQVCGGGHPGAVGGPGDTSRQWQQEAPSLGQVGCSLTPWLEARPEGQGLPVLFSPHSSCPRPLGWPPSLWPFPRWTPLSLEQQARREHRAGHTPSHKGRSLEPANGPHPPRLPSHMPVAVRSRREPSALCWDRVWRGRPRGWPGCPTGLRAPQSGSSLPAAPRCDLAPHPMPDSPPVVGDGGASLLCPGLSKPSTPPTPHPGSRCEAVCQTPCPLEQQTLLAGAPACSPSSGTGSL